MKRIERLVPGMWVSVPNVDEVPERVDNAWPPDDLVWAWYLSFEEVEARDMLVLSVRQSPLWSDTAIVVAWVQGKVCELHIKDWSFYGDVVIDTKL